MPLFGAQAVSESEPAAMTIRMSRHPRCLPHGGAARSAAVAALLLAAALPAWSQEGITFKRNVPAVRFTTPPVIDGDLSDPCWPEAAKADCFTDARSSKLVEDQTMVYLGYDDQNIYVGFHARDRQPEGIVARQKEEGAFPEGDDWFSFSIDPFHTHAWRGRFWVVINPRGTRFTHLPEDRWAKPPTVAWLSAARIGADGWTGEMAIPWKLLNYPNARDPLTCGLNLARFQARTGTRSWWSNIGIGEDYEQEGRWVGVQFPRYRRHYSRPPFSPEREMLEQLDEELTAHPAVISENWSLGAVDQSIAAWIDSSLPPAVRQGLGTVADHLRARAPTLPAPSRRDAYTLAARLYCGAGAMQKAITTAEAALRHPGGHERATLLLADLRYRANGKHGAPPVEEYVNVERLRYHTPGVSVAVIRSGQIVLAKGYGLANVELSVPATKDTVYGLASLTKQFTAAAVMMLVEEGKVSLDDKVSKHLLDLPAAWNDITVRQLLTHTSGVSDMRAAPDFWSRITNASSPEEVLKRGAPASLEFQPGEKWAYSNTGYFLLGMMIEKVSGKSLREFLAERIFARLGMTASRLDDARELIPNRASGYSLENNRLRNAEYWSPKGAYASGGLVSTASDLAKWDAALYTERLLRKSSLEQMWTPATLTSGETTGYGFGWFIGVDGGHRYTSHAGGIPGFSCYIVRFRDEKLTVIWLTNLDFGDPSASATGIARFYLSAPKPIRDTDPKTTQRLKAVLLNLAEGQADPAQFTPEAEATLRTEIKQASMFYQSLGPLNSFSLIEQKSDQKSRTYRYRVAFRNTNWIQTFVLTESGKVAEVGVGPG